MRPIVICLMLTVILVPGLGCRRTTAAQPQPKHLSLANGIRIVVLHVPASKSVSIFTYVPMGLASDGPGQAQWSHLVEHLVVRATVPFGSQQANAETLPDHMRLDFYGTTDNWEEGLSHHARWLQGTEFTEENFIAEKAHVNAECDQLAHNLATYKFAIAAWAQGYRFGRAHAGIKADVDRAALSDIQRYRDERLAVLDRTVVCVVGGLDPRAVLSVVTQRLGSITAEAQAPGPVEAPGGSREMTWDLDARHLVLTWPIPDISANDYPALMVAGQWLTAQLFADEGLKSLAGTALAGADLAVPEGDFFYVSAPLRPMASSDAVRRRFDEHLRSLRSDDMSLSGTPQIGRQLADSLTRMADPAELKALAPPGISPAMIEANLGLQYAMQEYRYGSHRAALAQKLATITAAQVRQAAQKWLAPDKAAVCVLRPSQDVRSVAE